MKIDRTIFSDDERKLIQLRFGEELNFEEIAILQHWPLERVLKAVDAILLKAKRFFVLDKSKELEENERKDETK